MRSWLPTFFREELGVNQSWAGVYGTMTFNTAAFGGMLRGGTASDWWAQRVSVAADGSLNVTQVAQVPALENAKTGVALSRGSLRIAEDDPSGTLDTTSVRTLATIGGRLTASEPQAGDKTGAHCPYAGADCSALWGNLGDGPRDVFLTTFYDGDEGGTGLSQADRLVAMPWVLRRWSANSSWVQLARSRPCLAGPSMTQRLISSAIAAGMPGSLPLAFPGARPARPRSQ